MEKVEKMKFWEAMKALEEGKGVINYHLGSSMAVKSPFHSFFRDDWEVCDGPEKTFSFAEVVKGLKEGKSFKRKSWQNSPFEMRPIVLHPGGCIDFSGGSRIWHLTIDDFEATDWVEVPQDLHPLEKQRLEGLAKCRQGEK